MKILLRNYITEVTRREASNFDRANRFAKNTNDFLGKHFPFKGAEIRKNNDIRDNFNPTSLDTNILKAKDSISNFAGDIGYNPIKSALLGLGAGYILLPNNDIDSEQIPVLPVNKSLPKFEVTENLGFSAPSGVATGTNTPTDSGKAGSDSFKPSKKIILKEPLFDNKKKNINENYIPNLELISKNFDYINLNKIDQKVRDYASIYGIDINGLNLHLYQPNKQMEIIKNKQMGIK